MKLRVFLLSLAAALLVSGYPPTQPTLALRPVQASRSTWRQFTSTQGGFSVLMPGKPRQFRQTQKTQIGPVDIRGFIVEQHKGTVAYLVMYADFPVKSNQKVNPNQLFDGAINQARKSTRGKLLSQQKLKLKGYPGREFTIETRGVIIKDRMYFVKPRMYQVMVVTTKDKQKSLSKSIPGFLNSFKLRSRR